MNYARLAAALARALQRDVSVAEAPGVLAQLTAAQLDALDPVLRYGFWDEELGRPIRGLAPLSLLEGSTEDRQAYLFTASCNPNGFLREQALQAMRHTRGRIAVCAALIRCNDWVGQVRSQAISLLADTLAEVPEVIWECLDLFLSLKQRQRVREQTWTKLVDPLLASPEHAEARWHAAQNGSSGSRLLAYELIAQHDSHRTADACLQAVCDPNPCIARWAISQVSARARPDAYLKVLEAGMTHPHASVRTASLREYARRESSEVQHIAMRGLFDTSSSYPNASAYLLRTSFQVDPLEIWRKAIDEGPELRTAVAIMAMAEHAEACDFDRLLPFARDRRVRQRMLALRGLARTKHADLPNLFAAALQDHSPKVLRQTVAILRTDPSLLSEPPLSEAYLRSDSSAVRAQLIKATHVLGKWTCIALLLEWLADADEATEPHIVAAIHRWLQRETRSFSPLSEVDRQRILSSMAAARQHELASALTRLSHALGVS